MSCQEKNKQKTDISLFWMEWVGLVLIYIFIASNLRQREALATQTKQMWIKIFFGMMRHWNDDASIHKNWFLIFFFFCWFFKNSFLVWLLILLFDAAIYIYKNWCWRAHVWSIRMLLDVSKRAKNLQLLPIFLFDFFNDVPYFVHCLLMELQLCSDDLLPY